MTKTPANLKNILANFPLITEVKPPIPSSPGVVPIANSPITIEPVTKLPLLIATNCMAWVKPHGRKNVNPPSTNAFCDCIPFVFLIDPKNFAIPAGNVIPLFDNLGNNSVN